MIKRTTILLAAGALAGGVLGGAPSFALAGQITPQQELDEANHLSDMNAMMSGDGFQGRMRSAMSEVMADPKLREQMRSMMSDVMSGMDMGGDMTHSGEHADIVGGTHGMHGDGEGDGADE